MPNDIETLHDLNDALTSPDSPAVNAVKIVDPLDSLERSMGEFVSDSLALVTKRHSFEEELMESVRESLPEASFEQKATLLMEQQRANNDMHTRVVQPFAIIATEKAKARAEQGGVFGGDGASSGDSTFKKAPKEILQGLTALNQLLEIAASAAAKKNTIDG